MEKFIYDVKVLAFMRNAVTVSEQMEYELVMDYIEYCNDICPSCRGKMKVYNREIKNIGSFILGGYDSVQLVVPYVICKKCNKDMSVLPAFMQQKKMKETEDYVFDVLQK